MNNSWHNYSSIYNLGHRYLEDLLKDPVLVEEKVDGSQFSFGLINGELLTRSKGQTFPFDASPKMFARGVETVKKLADLELLTPGWTYRAELLDKPKHNSLNYARVPNGNVILFDIAVDEEDYLPYTEKEAEAKRLGLEVVPKVFEGELVGIDIFKEFLNRESILGGAAIEGVVIKNYKRFGLDKKVLMGKYVSDAFKEVHVKEWKANNPTRIDVIEGLINQYKTPARWEKAVQHLRDLEQLEQSPRDIGKLIMEVKADVERECADEIAQALLKWALPNILRGASGGLPEWYKEQLLKEQFT